MPNEINNYFYIKDCTLSPVATGVVATNLKELRDHITTIPLGSIYQHFWGHRIWRQFEIREYHNDFAVWVRNALYDRTLAERLAMIDPTDFKDLELLRNAVIATLDVRIQEIGHDSLLVQSHFFHFVKSQIIVLPTSYVLKTPQELCDILPHLSVNTIFYHFIDALCRPPFFGQDDFSVWFESFDHEYEVLIQQLKDIDYYFIPLHKLQLRLHSILCNFFNKG